MKKAIIFFINLPIYLGRIVVLSSWGIYKMRIPQKVYLTRGIGKNVRQTGFDSLFGIFFPLICDKGYKNKILLWPLWKVMKDKDNNTSELAGYSYEGPDFY